MSTFADVLREGILSLPHDLKAMLRIVEDPELDDPGRVLACGAILHVLSGHNAIPGVKGILGFADDVIVLRLVVERLGQSSPDVIAHHTEDSPEIVGLFAEQLAVVRDHLGELLVVIDHAVDALPKSTFEGHDAVKCARDAESATWLYDSVQEAIVERLELDPDAVVRAVKGASEIKGLLKQRL